MKKRVPSLFTYPIACLLLLGFSTAYSQVISVDEYLRDPSLIKMRLLANGSPKVLSSLMERYESTDSHEDKANCLKVINASVIQTRESKQFVRKITTDSSTHRLILEHAIMGNWLNNENRKASDLFGKEFVYWHRVSKIGQRLEFLLDQTETEDGNLDLYFLFSDRSRAFSSEIGEVFDRSLRRRVDRWLSLADPFNDAGTQAREELERVLDAFRKENVVRKILSQVLTSQQKASHLGESSMRSSVVMTCLKRLDSNSISQTNFGWLKAMADPTLVDQESSALFFYMASLEGILRKKRAVHRDVTDAKRMVEYFAENLFLDYAPQYLKVAADTERAMETRMIALQCLKIVSATESDHIRNRCRTLVDRFITSSEEDEVAIGIDLVGVAPSEIQANALSQIAFHEERSASPILRARASLALLKETTPGGNNLTTSAVGKQFFENYAQLGIGEKIELANSLATVDAKKSFSMLFELLCSQTEKDTERVAELCGSMSNLFKTEFVDRIAPRRMFQDLSRKEVQVAGPLIFSLFGSSRSGLNSSVTESLTEYLIDYNPYGLNALYAFIKDNKGSVAANSCTEFLLTRSFKQIQSNTEHVKRLFLLNPDPEAFSFYVANIGPVIEGAIAATRINVESNWKKIFVEEFLASTKIVFEELKKISNDDDHDLKEFADQQLKRVHDFIGKN